MKASNLDDGTIQPPPKAATVIISAWGYRYIEQFLNSTLPALLAPKNLPAVAKVLDTRFIVLSRRIDADLIQTHPHWLALAKICTAEIHYLDRFLVDEDSMVTVTLGFSDVIRQTHAATDTCFILLMANQLLADGSLMQVVARFLAGSDIVIASSIRVDAESVLVPLSYYFDPERASLSIESRELMKIVLLHLHITERANILNNPGWTDVSPYKFFWEADDHTIVAKIYGAPPVGIRPKIRDFVVKSYFNYSFIPEMCPTGNIVVLTDSDDYLAVELVPRRWNINNIKPNLPPFRELAKKISKWTPKENFTSFARTFIYHALNIQDNVSITANEANTFVCELNALLVGMPSAARTHPNWLLRDMKTGEQLTGDDWDQLSGKERGELKLRQFLSCINRRVFGEVPKFTQFHPRWADFSLALKCLSEGLFEEKTVAVVGEEPATFGPWLSKAAYRIATIEWDRLAHSFDDAPPAWFARLFDTFDIMLLIIREPLFDALSAVLENVAFIGKQGSSVCIFVINDRPSRNASLFSQVYAEKIGVIYCNSYTLTQAEYLSYSILHWRLYRMFDKLLQVARHKKLNLASLVIVGVFQLLIGVVSYVVNWRVRRTSSPSTGRLLSSICLRFKVNKVKRKRGDLSYARKG